MRATLKTICAGVVFESGTETNILVRLQNFKASNKLHESAQPSALKNAW